MAAKKVTGEEDHFFHTDLSDFEANVDDGTGLPDRRSDQPALTTPRLPSDCGCAMQQFAASLDEADADTLRQLLARARRRRT